MTIFFRKGSRRYQSSSRRILTGTSGMLCLIVTSETLAVCERLACSFGTVYCSWSTDIVATTRVSGSTFKMRLGLTPFVSTCSLPLYVCEYYVLDCLFDCLDSLILVDTSSYDDVLGLRHRWVYKRIHQPFPDELNDRSFILNTIVGGLGPGSAKNMHNQNSCDLRSYPLPRTNPQPYLRTYDKGVLRRTPTYPVTPRSELRLRHADGRSHRQC